MKVFKAPHRDETERPLNIFLAGSIEMGVAEDWQTRITKKLSKYNVNIFNPRRDDWDSSWEQDPTPGTQFYEQVEWEWDHIKEADLVLFYFDVETKSPITLMELGYALGIGKDVLVCCGKDFHRYGNVAMVMRLEDEEENLFIDEDDWTLKIVSSIAAYEAIENIEESVEEPVAETIEESVEENRVRVLQEASNKDVQDYVLNRHKKGNNDA